VAEWLGRGLQSLVQRFESARRLPAVLGLGLVLAGCGEAGEPKPGSSQPDARLLVVQLSDLPPRFSLVPAESFPVSLATVLAEPWSAGVRDIVEGERVSGYQMAFSSPRARHIQCNAAVYRSTSGAAEVFAARGAHFAEFAAATGGGRVTAETLGEETRTFRYRLRGPRAITVSWRSRNVLSSCTTVSSAPHVAELLLAARAQQRRIAESQEPAVPARTIPPL